ncbi:hypothetical protein [Spirosoma sordidisoli]|uniref:Uncharacterized protein n=1 Tax=Spirosoma sordidisoli TaxID=2502893 RepID=A0A4V1RWW2_9BACT|nr:hypothetical protein [Spirosoma sordidisoli]RYC71658.1 hypothetical protein EQG79_05870 [Spirosoma sordidisoli]
MNKFTFHPSQVTVLLDATMTYVRHYQKVSTKSIAKELEISASYFYGLKNPNNHLSYETRKNYLVRLLKKYKLSILVNDNGEIGFIHEDKESYYIHDCYIYLFEKDTKVLKLLEGRIDVLEQNYTFRDIKNDESYIGSYTLNNGSTLCKIYEKPVIANSEEWSLLTDDYYINKNQKNDEENNEIRYAPAKLIYEISIAGDLSTIENNCFFGSFTRDIGYSNILSGRIFISTEKINDSTDYINTYLTNQKFHEFYDHSITVKNINDLKPLVEYFNNKFKFIEIEIPKELVTSYQQFLSFFTNYVEITKGKNIKFDVLKRNESLIIDMELVDESITVSDFEIYLSEYINFTKKNIDSLSVNIETPITKEGFDIFVLELKQQITNLKHSMELANLKNSMLQKENDRIYTLLERITNKDNIIHAQLINGGNQQFADIIKHDL